MKSVIGKGSYGKVLLVTKKDNNKQYALKILKKDEIIKRN
jgi:protein-serine/threonine kinase